eukprot:gene4325-14437_t
MTSAAPVVPPSLAEQSAELHERCGKWAESISHSRETSSSESKAPAGVAELQALVTQHNSMRKQLFELEEANGAVHDDSLVAFQMQSASREKTLDQLMEQLDTAATIMADILDDVCDTHIDKTLFQVQSANSLVTFQMQSASRQKTLDQLMEQLDTAAMIMTDILDDVCDTHIDSSKEEGAAPEAARVLPAPGEILEYGRILRFTTFSNAGLITLPQMIGSALYKFSHERALEEAAASAQAPPIKAQVQSNASAMDVDKVPLAKEDAVMPAMPPLPPMPPGWQPGDPLPEFPPGFQLPPGFPEPPPGWKPGDPLVLPEAEGAVAAVQAEEMVEVEEEAVPVVARSDLLSFILNPDIEATEDYSTSDEDEDSDF